MTPINLFCSDLDGTLLGNPESTNRFKVAWESISHHTRPLLCYASGRLVNDVLQVVQSGTLPTPNYILGGVGTQIYDTRQLLPLADYDQRFRDGWDLARVEEIVARTPGISRQPPQFLHPYKSSWYLDQATPETLSSLKQALQQAGLHATLIYSSHRHLDVLPSNTDKGSALRWLCHKLGIPLHRVLVAGDSGNDASLFLLPGVQGIIVENAQPELIEAAVKIPTFNATRIMADGVLEGLRHFSILPPPTVVTPPPQTATPLDLSLRTLFTHTPLGSLSQEERATINEAYRQALLTLRRNITPQGFSACSLNHNEVTGTDANYRSVWARDGSITIVGSIDLDDPDIRAAQRQTLQTLFANVAPNGQIPANVRLDDGSPDYSGVGGICSIDSGLWIIVALHAYVRKTGDLDFLATHTPAMHRVMQWLCALDSNNDGLLEIPEAGDWTDLFGRSYHVLYDEVLWYRALVAYSRLLELLRDFDTAADFLRRSQTLRSRILDLFWPTTRSVPGQSFHFARSQSSVGDARYLLAEITPFGFNWRCDVLGNIQAFIANVIDIERARTAFKFMWGVGVNDPYPVVNLYPAVQSGDPDWRPYYTVNLLNLPGHYHNGGIWPFIGGMWVRFIHRLGLHDIACHELHKLALLNKLGRNQEWEFNEWVHSRTGRPMGKCFQAWSASSFIHACHELQINPDHLPHE